MRDHWGNCITHFDDKVDGFLADYFGEPDRRCLLVAAAGFDPRSQVVTRKLSAILGDRLKAFFIREERGRPAENLLQRADENEATLRSVVQDAEVVKIDVFAEDGAAVGGQRLIEVLRTLTIPEDVTDVVLDMSALSIGIGFPAARLLLERCERAASRSFHLVIVSNPELDERISSEPADRPLVVRGFAGTSADGDLPKARIWLPQLAHGRSSTLSKIGLSIDERYKVCPIVPFPSRNPRRADELITEYRSQLVNEWDVDPRDLVYVSERNPLDCYRTLQMLKQRHDKAVAGVYEPQIILSPVGSKVLAAGAMMAAIEYDLAIHYLETLRYDFDGIEDREDGPPDIIVHMLLSGPAYGDYGGIATASDV